MNLQRNYTSFCLPLAAGCVVGAIAPLQKQPRRFFQIDDLSLRKLHGLGQRFVSLSQSVHSCMEVCIVHWQFLRIACSLSVSSEFAEELRFLNLPDGLTPTLGNDDHAGVQD